MNSFSLLTHQAQFYFGLSLKAWKSGIVVTHELLERFFSQCVSLPKLDRGIFDERRSLVEEGQRSTAQNPDLVLVRESRNL